MYAINAIVQRERDGWSTARPLPTFYLDERVQGIVSESHAERIATGMLHDVVTMCGATSRDVVLYVSAVKV